MRAVVVCFLLVPVVALGASGCEPGSRYGRAAAFALRETLSSNTCGVQSVPVAAEVRYRAELAVELGKARWRVLPQGGAAVGEYTAETRAFRFASESFLTLRGPDRVSGRAACVLRRLDVIEGTLSAPLPVVGDAGIEDDATSHDAGDAGLPTLTATETVVFGPVVGADCADAVGANDGQFTTLPCEQRFAIHGDVETVP